MAVPTLTPTSTTSAVRLPSTGSYYSIATALPFSTYTGSSDFLSGARDQVAYTYKKLGGDILDIELSESNVYSAYQEAVLEYSYIVNVHQGKNILSDVLGETTGTFDHNGNLKTGVLSSSLAFDHPTGSHPGISLKLPTLKLGYAKRAGEAFSNEAGYGGYDTIYSASISMSASVQDYDLQNIISSSAKSDSALPYYDKVKGNKILIKDVFYKTPAAMWRFYGYYGGLNTVGNLQNYGQFADDSQFQIVPVWQNKQQSLAFEDSIYTRNSHYSYEIHNNKLRIYPTPHNESPSALWVRFTIPNEKDAWDEDSDKYGGVNGINNLNTIPFGNIPFASINAIGKQWIRRFALALAKEMLGYVRSKFSTIPIPGESVTLNGEGLISQAKEEQSTLREELKTVLDELTYAKLAEKEAMVADSVGKTQEKVPLRIYVG